MVNSKVELCNLALNSLGESRITSLDDSDDTSIICNLNFNPLLDRAVEMYPWTFALERQQLAELTSTNYTQYEYKYQLPVDPYCLRPVILLDENYIEQSRNDFPFIVEGRSLYTDLETAYLKYIRRVTDITQIGSGFVMFFVEFMASKLAFRITGDETKEKYHDALARELLSEAMGNDAEISFNKEDIPSWYDPSGNINSTADSWPIIS